MAQLNYDTSTITPDEGRSLWNPGRYAVEIIKADVLPTRSGLGEYVSVELRTEEGRAYYARYNVQNESAEAERIGRQQFAALHHAAGLPVLRDTDQLIGRKVVIELGVKKRKDNNEEENVIRGHYPAGTPVAAAPVAKPLPAAGNAPVPPWASGKAA